MANLRLEQLPAGSRDLLRAVLDVARDRAPVVVGGVVRDARLRRRRDGAKADVDVTVARDALDTARRVADRVGGAYVALDEERGAARVVTADARLDVTDLRAPTLEADLAARDFTVNALAVPLAPLLERGRAAIVDPTGGLADLAAGRLRPAGPTVLADDPVRALRGVRLEAELPLRLTAAAARAIRAVAPTLTRVSPERIRDEILAILRVPQTAPALRRLDALGLLTVVFPEVEPMRRSRQPLPHRFTVLEHSLRAVGGADRLLARLDDLEPFGDELAAHVRTTLGGGIDRRQVLKLAALLHDVSKPETRREVNGRIRFFEHDTIGADRVRAIGERLKLPERATTLLERLVRHHLRMMHLGQAGEVTSRARYRFFRDLREDARDLLLLSLVDAAAVTGESPRSTWRRATLIHDLLRGWSEDQDLATAPPLVRGEDVMRHFGLPPGPVVGALLRRAREAQDLGLVRTRDDVLAFLDSSENGQ
ncbi:MAG: HD domain-containing protein [Candidatus Rokubacteria bacterium]|nr:HD domain-containing protein [Candidatus Rokubacteria bacterium]